MAYIYLTAKIQLLSHFTWVLSNLPKILDLSRRSFFFIAEQCDDCFKLYKVITTMENSHVFSHPVIKQWKFILTIQPSRIIFIYISPGQVWHSTKAGKKIFALTGPNLYMLALKSCLKYSRWKFALIPATEPISLLYKQSLSFLTVDVITGNQAVSLLSE